MEAGRSWSLGGDGFYPFVPDRTNQVLHAPLPGVRYPIVCFLLFYCSRLSQVWLLRCVGLSTNDESRKDNNCWIPNATSDSQCSLCRYMKEAQGGASSQASRASCFVLPVFSIPMQASNMEPTELARDTTHRNVEIIRCPYMFLFSVRAQMPVH